MTEQYYEDENTPHNSEQGQNYVSNTSSASSVSRRLICLLREALNHIALFVDRKSQRFIEFDILLLALQRHFVAS